MSKYEKKIIKAFGLLVLIAVASGCAEKNEKTAETKTEVNSEVDCSSDIDAYNMGRKVADFQEGVNFLEGRTVLKNFKDALRQFCEVGGFGLYELGDNECAYKGYSDYLSGKDNPYENRGTGSASNQGIPKNSETQPIRYNTVSETLAKTSMSLNKKENDFGIIQEGDTVECDIIVTNTGGQQLILEDAHGSCVGLTAEFSKDPIPAGQSRNVKIKFNSIGKSGKQYQSVVFIANTDPIHTGVAIFAEVHDNVTDGE